jgi:hypothetical protein
VGEGEWLEVPKSTTTRFDLFQNAAKKIYLHHITGLPFSALHHGGSLNLRELLCAFCLVPFCCRNSRWFVDFFRASKPDI